MTGWRPCSSSGGGRVRPRSRDGGIGYHLTTPALLIAALALVGINWWFDGDPAATGNGGPASKERPAVRLRKTVVSPATNGCTAKPEMRHGVLASARGLMPS